ncbi:MAG: hypothetical protein AB1898_31230 [Acidobacteriota bacterium]
MPIPDLKWWRGHTSKVLSDRKNPLILDIDILLAEYHKQGKTDIQKQKILILMLYYCTEWLVSKGEKETSWRRPHVQKLVSEIESELRTPAMLQATQDRIAGKKGKKLEEDPIEVLQPRDARNKFGLRTDVTSTRRSAHGALTFINNFAASKKLTGYKKELQDKQITDYVDQLQILAAGAHQVTRNLEYLSKLERRACHLQKWPDGLFHLAGRDTPYQTSTATDANGNRILDLFAMDDMEFLYVGPPKQAGTFHHSSFLSGKPVLCAGEIALDQGKITKVSNSSGHYRPSTRDLLNCVLVLEKKYSVDTQTLTVSDMATGTDWKSASQFLQRQGRPPVKIGNR